MSLASDSLKVAYHHKHYAGHNVYQQGWPHISHNLQQHMAMHCTAVNREGKCLPWKMQELYHEVTA